MTAYIYKIRTGGYQLVIKSKNKILSKRKYVTMSSALDDAKHCTPGNY